MLGIKVAISDLSEDTLLKNLTYINSYFFSRISAYVYYFNVSGAYATET